MQRERPFSWPVTAPLPWADEVWASEAAVLSRGVASIIPPRSQVLIRSGQVPIVSLECVSCKAQAVYAVSRSSYVYLEGRCDNCSGGSKRGVSWVGPGWGRGSGGGGASVGCVQALEVAAAPASPLSTHLHPAALGSEHLQQRDTGAG